MRWNIAKNAPSISGPLAVVTDAQLNVFHHTVEQTLVHMNSDTPDPIPHLSGFAAKSKKNQSTYIFYRRWRFLFRGGRDKK